MEGRAGQLIMEQDLTPRLVMRALPAGM